MDEGLRRAAQSGNVASLYALIQADANVFRHIDQMEFVDTPLHIAAAAGHTDFAMEMMNLKPSLARKLNQDGFSPVHLALQHGQTEMVADLMSVDKDLVRVKGREGYTPLHYLAREGNVPLLSQFLDNCPDGIFDLTIRKESALHIAAKYNRLEAFKTILQRIQSTNEGDRVQRTRILNLQDKDGNTVLHIAASNNQPLMIKPLTKCKEVDKKKNNREGFTALHLLQRQTLVDSRESVNILTRAPSSFCEMPSFETKLKNSFKRMKPETINALLVVFALIQQMTYQALSNPPKGASQSDSAGSNKEHEGKSALEESQFYFFYIPNGLAFVVSWIGTMTLFEVVTESIMSFLNVLSLLMCFCYGVATAIIAPSARAGVVTIGVVLSVSFFLFTKR